MREALARSSARRSINTAFVERRESGAWTQRTPAMAASLTDHVWSISAWIKYPMTREDGSTRTSWELSDLVDDPHELNNVVADPARAAPVRTFKAELKDTDQFDGDLPTTGVAGPPVKS